MEIQKELVPIEKTVNLVSKKVTDLVIKDAESMANATELLSQINQYADSLEEKKQEVVKPLNEALKKFRSMFKPLEEKCETAITSIRFKMTVYQTAQIAKEKEKEAKLVAKMESGEIDMDKAVNKLSKIARVEKTVSTDSGSVQFVETLCFEVTDIKDLPIQYHLADEVAIRKDLKEGRDIPGVRKWTEQRPKNSR